ncbi:unnamed protein product [Brassicogethes aeneus]|uniref:DUF4806 domain-containing protein n=1 Tax=Brassicogethes aeneus TaxID=1431903 RepID=A0A9P0FC26_BRAAE|nr:unnamed protein product [Brassicogethes aeneus]
MKMYAVVEFEGRKCSVVPINWLADEQKYCYWPKGNISSRNFDEIVQSCRKPEASWKKYRLIKIFKITDDFSEANNILKNSIEESTSSGTDMEPLILMDTLVDEKENMRAKKRDYDDVSFSDDKASISSFSDGETTTACIIHTEKIRRDASHVNSLPISSPVLPATPGSSSSSLRASNSDYLLETILRKVELLSQRQEQHTVLLNNILTTNQAANSLTMEKPTDIPNLPITNKQDYRAVEEFLKVEEKFNYMKTRLACIGGSSVRNAVMHMMKFMLSDKIAVKFNWSGRDHKKKAFRDTLMSKAIQEATMSAFSRLGDRSDLNDKNIQSAIQDWLKLAKHRLEQREKKKSRDN